MVNSNGKGKRGEREAAKALRETLGCKARRGQQYAGGNDSPDVVHDISGIHIEVKRTERLKLYDAVGQALEDCADGEVPVVLHKRNREFWLVVVPLCLLVPFCRAIVRYVDGGAR